LNGDFLDDGPPYHHPRWIEDAPPKRKKQNHAVVEPAEFRVCHEVANAGARSPLEQLPDVDLE